MTCKIERPDPAQLFQKYLTMFSNTVLGGAPVVPESNEWYAVAVNYAMAEEFHAISEQAWKERDPREACCENLIDMAAVDGVFPRPAVHAQGYVKITGTPGSELPAPLEFVIGGLNFITASTATQPSIVGEDGTVVIRVRAITPGAAGNISEAQGQLLNSVSGVERDVEICGGQFCEGTDAEPCEAFRARYLRRLQYNPRATNQWIIDKMLEWPCSTRAIQRAGSCCQCNSCEDNPAGCEDCGCKDCGGQLAFYVMFDNTFPCGIAPRQLLDEVQEWMFGSPQGYGLGQAEVGICGRIASVNGFEVDVIVDIAACPTSAQVSQIRSQIAEFFGTLEPSQPLRKRNLDTLIANIVGADVNFDVRFNIVDPDIAYGNEFGQFRSGDLVYLGGCDLEPECDAMPCLRDVVINRPDTSGVSC